MYGAEGWVQLGRSAQRAARSAIETLRASGDSAGHPVPEDPSALTPLPHYPLSPHPFSLFRPFFVGGWFKAACTTTAWGLGLERLGEMWSHPMSAFTSTPSERTMDEHSSEWRYLVGLANCPWGRGGSLSLQFIFRRSFVEKAYKK
eukprot:scaffold2973_cov114-Isochrysis_galbana.AAC.4